MVFKAHWAITKMAGFWRNCCFFKSLTKIIWYYYIFFSQIFIKFCKCCHFFVLLPVSRKNLNNREFNIIHESLRQIYFKDFHILLWFKDLLFEKSINCHEINIKREKVLSTYFRFSHIPFCFGHKLIKESTFVSDI